MPALLSRWPWRGSLRAATYRPAAGVEAPPVWQAGMRWVGHTGATEVPLGPAGLDLGSDKRPTFQGASLPGGLRCFLCLPCCLLPLARRLSSLQPASVLVLAHEGLSSLRLATAFHQPVPHLSNALTSSKQDSIFFDGVCHIAPQA